MNKVSNNWRCSGRLDRYWLLCVVALTLGLGSMVQAQEGASNAPEKFAENVKNDLMAVIRAKDQYEEKGGSEGYIAAVEDVLEPVVDFDWIALAVMGKHRKDATAEQRQNFIRVFKRGLVTTYANGLAGFVDYDIDIVPPKGDVANKNRVSVGLKVTGGGSVNRVAFSLRRNGESGWKIANMILNGTNFGSLMQKQFAQAMEKSNNDIDQVIAGWNEA